MITCLSCGTENPSGQRFCGECGARLGAPGPDAAEERKVVTALFCDLVGFTATSEAADPEDVDRMLSTYAAMATGHIERHGGVVEKFIGDAVVGIFGVPAAHEDDPERAVRAALRIAEDAEDLEGSVARPSGFAARSVRPMRLEPSWPRSSRPPGSVTRTRPPPSCPPSCERRSRSARSRSPSGSRVI